jgi:hypothetical protein
LRDWGEPEARDRQENELSLKYGWRIVSSYPVGEKTVWIITEAGRSAKATDNNATSHYPLLVSYNPP